MREVNSPISKDSVRKVTTGFAPFPFPLEAIVVEGFSAYSEACEFQLARRGLVERGEAPDTLFLLEHAPVMTLGRNWKRENLLLSPEALRAQGIDVCETDRGGDVTYHGPGQLVAYPILDLRHWQCSVGWYLRALEEVLIRLLATYALKGERLQGFTGVWVNGAKVAAIGIGVRNWVTFHGIALNVDPDMNHFRLIVPCGIADKPVTSLALLLGTPPPMQEVMNRFEEAFKQTFTV